MSRLRFPAAGMTRFFKQEDSADDRAGRVTITGTEGVLKSWRVNNKVLTANVNKERTEGTITFTIQKVSVPLDIGTYNFGIDSTIEPDPGTPHGDTLHSLFPYDHHGANSNPRYGALSCR